MELRLCTRRVKEGTAKAVSGSFFANQAHQAHAGENAGLTDRALQGTTHNPHCVSEVQ